MSFVAVVRRGGRGYLLKSWGDILDQGCLFCEGMRLLKRHGGRESASGARCYCFKLIEDGKARDLLKRSFGGLPLLGE